MSPILPSSVSSPEDLLAVAKELKQLSSAISKRSRFKDNASKTPYDRLSGMAIDVVKEQKRNLTSDIMLGAFAQELLGVIKTAPQIVVVLAAPVTPDLRDTLTEWFRKNLSPTVLIRIQFNPSLLGGIIVRYKSHIYDWSFRSSILQKKDNFAKVLLDV